MLDSVRVRLALWHVVVLAFLQVAFCLAVYLLLIRGIYRSVDGILTKVNQDVVAALTFQVQHAQDLEAVPSRALEMLYHTGGAFAIYDPHGKLLAERPLGTAARLAPFPTDSRILSSVPYLYTWEKGPQNRHRLSVQAAAFPERKVSYVVITSHMLDPMLSDVRLVQTVFIVAVPIVLMLAGTGGWLLARKSLAPVVAMAERARRIGEYNDRERLEVENPRDELGQLSHAFNELLDRLSNALMQQRQFMADAAHELRTPISVIRTSAEVILDQEHGAEQEYREALKIAAAQSCHLSRTVEDVFRLARSDMGREKIAFVNVYLDEIVQEAGQNAAILARARGIRMDICEQRESPFQGDEELLRQMVSNLLANSLKFTPPGGTIRLCLEQVERHYIVTVQDSGVGIPPEACEHIFDRFYQAKHAPALQPGTANLGSGLGLSIAQWVAEAHHGTLRLQSTSSQGSTFVATLPVDVLPA